MKISSRSRKAISWVLMAIATALTLVLIGKVAVTSVAQSHSYYSSKYSKYCYPRTIANYSIKKKIYYPSLEECGKPPKPNL